VFDRELPMVRCGHPIRHRVAEAEWRYRRRAQPPIAEHTLVDVANETLVNAGAPTWARVSIEELHVLRTALRPVLPRFVGTVGGDLGLSDQMSPVEAVFVAMTLGTGMLHDPDEFRGGPQTYLQRVRERQLNPPPTGAVRVVQAVAPDPTRGFDDQNGVLARSARRFLDQLGFPP
jgi:hypothetical protein